MSPKALSQKTGASIEEVQRELLKTATSVQLKGKAPWQKGMAETPTEKKQQLFVPAIIFVMAAATIIFAGTLRFEFLDFDDTKYVLYNPWIRSLSIENLVNIFTKPYFHNYAPLHLVSYQLDYFLWGENPLGYHLHSVLLHALNSVLVCLVIHRLSGKLSAAFLTAVFFAFHPSHVESVAWVSSRKDLISMAFILLSLYTYIRSRSDPERAFITYMASIFFYLLAVLSKPIVVLLPVFLIIVEMAETAGSLKKRMGLLWRQNMNKLPYIVIGLVVVYINNQAQVKAKAAYAQEPIQYTLVKGHAVWNYFFLLTGLTKGRPTYDLPTFGLMAPATLKSLTAIALVIILTWLAYRWRHREFVLGLSWIFIMLLPALAFPLVTYMADRYLYAPSMGFCWLLSLVILKCASCFASDRAKILCVTGAAIAISSLSVFRTLQYLPVWKNPETFWSYTVQTSRGVRSRNALAVVRIRQGRIEEALRLLNEAATVPNFTTYRNYGILYDKQGRYEEALKAYDHAIELYRKKPSSSLFLADLYYNQGVVFWKMGDFMKASKAFEETLRITPHHIKAEKWLEKAKQRQKKLQQDENC